MTRDDWPDGTESTAADIAAGNVGFRADGTAVLVIRPAQGVEGDDDYRPALVAELATVEHPGALFNDYDETTTAIAAAELENESTRRA